MASCLEDDVSNFIFYAQIEAKTIFQKLDARFDPQMFLVGFTISEKRGESWIQVGPDGTPFRPEAFVHVRSQAAVYEKEDPENESYWTDDEMQRERSCRSDSGLCTRPP